MVGIQTQWKMLKESRFDRKLRLMQAIVEFKVNFRDFLMFNKSLRSKFEWLCEDISSVDYNIEDSNGTVSTSVHEYLVQQNLLN